MASFFEKSEDQERFIDIDTNPDDMQSSQAKGTASSDTPELYEKEDEGAFGRSATTGPSLRARLPAFPSSLSSVSLPTFISKDGTSGSHYLLMAFGGLLVGFIIVLGLAVAVGQLNKPKTLPKLCTDRDCLWEASYVKSNMNESVDPCKDFFHYACGNFPVVNPLVDAGGDVDVMTVIENANDQKLSDALEAPIKDYRDVSAEKKMKTFFQSCLDDYYRTALGGGPLVQMINNLGGWASLAGTFDPSKWDNQKLNDVLKRAHADYGIDPFFLITVGDDRDIWQKPPKETYMVQFRPASVAMYSLRDYTTNTSSSRKHQAGYKDFMRTYLQLLWSDSGRTPKDINGTLDQLWSDVMKVETAIATYSNGFIIIDPTHSHVPLSQLDQVYKGRIDWFQLVSYYFQGGGITQNTPVHLYYINYMKKMTNFISTLNMTTINNYIMWKVAYQYVHELGWEYLHANRIWAWIKYDGYVRYVGHYRWCIIEIQRNLQYLLSALYVQDNFNSFSLPQVQKLYYYMNQTIQNRMGGWTWMDSGTKTEALKKIRTALAKIGHPSWMQDNVYLNNYYKTMKIYKNQHLQNMQRIYQFERYEATKQIAIHTVDRTKWPLAIYDTYLKYDGWWNEIFIPAGMLQHPLFDWRIPQYMNFAAAGRYIGEKLINTVDTDGNWLDHSGNYNNWWSHTTTNNFKNVQQCHAMLYANASYCYDKNPAHCYLGRYRDVAQMAKPNWRDVGAVSIAYDAFQAFDRQYGSSGSFVGLQSDSLAQVFFLGFAQTFCYSRSAYHTYWYWYWYANPPEPIFVNKVLGQIPAFASAYQCASNSPMVSSRCPGF